MRLLLIAFILLAGCSTTERLAWGTLYTVDYKNIEHIRGALISENFLLAKDMTLSNSGIVTVQRLSQNGASVYYLTVRYQGPEWRFMEDVILKIDGKIITLVDDDPYRYVNSYGGVEEVVRCHLDENMMERLNNCSSLVIQYYSKPLTIPFEGLIAMKEFIK